MYFKKQIAFLLAAFLLFSNVGLAVNMHYCQGKIETVTLSYHFASSPKDHEQDSHSCCKEKPQKEQKKKNCCSDEIVKKAGDQVIVKVLNFHVDAFVPSGYSSFFFNVTATEFIPKNTFTAFYIDKNAPPLFKLYQQFLLYA